MDTMPQPDGKKQLTWSRADSERMAGARPQVRIAQFTPGTNFEDESLTPLESAPKLFFVRVEGSDLTRANLLALASLPAATRLDLKGCRFDPRDFAAFCARLAAGGSPKLTEIWLENAAVGDGELAAVGTVERLRWLILSGTRITDEGLKHLHPIQKLETLWLDRTGVTDDGVLGLAVLPHLDGLPTRETKCSPDIKDRLFRAQMERQKAKTPINEAQAAAADARLRDFLKTMDAWERAVWTRAQEVENKFRDQRPQPNVFSQAESEANRVFLRDINEQKAVIAARYCSEKLLGRGAGSAHSYGSEPRFKTQVGDWILVETPSKTKTVFTGPGDHDGKRRYTLKWEADDWKLDDVQWWNGGWKRDYV